MPIYTATVVFTDDNTVCRFAGVDDQWYVEVRDFPLDDEASLRKYIDHGTATFLPMKYGRDYLERLSYDQNKDVSFGKYDK